MTGADPYDQLRAPVGVLSVHIASANGRYPLQHTPPQLPQVAHLRCPTGRMAAVIEPGLDPEPLAPGPGHQAHLHGGQQGVPEWHTRSQLPHRLTLQHLADALQVPLVRGQEPFPDAQMPRDEHTGRCDIRGSFARGPPHRQRPDSPFFSSHDRVSCAVGPV